MCFPLNIDVTSFLGCRQGRDTIHLDTESKGSLVETIARSYPDLTGTSCRSPGNATRKLRSDLSACLGEQIQDGETCGCNNG